MRSRRQLRRIGREYEAAVPPLIAGAQVVLDPEVLAAADDASAELVRFDAEAAPIAGAFAAILLRTESASSSEVENLTAGAKAVALAELGKGRSPNAKLVAANTRAMQAALRLSTQLDESAVIAMHAALLGESAPGIVGRWRSQQVWIGGTSLSPHGAEFVPPHHDRVPQLMGDLLYFADRTDVPVLVQAAIAHAQFETIHPFPDGNGRTGRALLHAMLRAGGLTRHTVVPVSAGLLHSPRDYFDALTSYRAGDADALTSYRAGDADAIVRAIADASFAAIGNARTLIGAIAAARSRWVSVVAARSDSAVHRLLDLLQTRPMLSAAIIADELHVSDVAAGAAIRRLVDAGVLTQAAGGERYRLWQAPEILDALDGFAERARRGRHL
ncbi:Fic family protein [Microbacterium sp.]|uniref:Fic family protein n=1 Tax=Microbacterium sp. TaxID=51671 RepID=UPI003C7200B8